VHITIHPTAISTGIATSDPKNTHPTKKKVTGKNIKAGTVTHMARAANKATMNAEASPFWMLLSLLISLEKLKRRSERKLTLLSKAGSKGEVSA